MLNEEEIRISNYTMKEFHDNLILVLLEIDRICKKNNIPYVFTGGTALGAVRHSDFIPWDDDADIGMSRRNYNKFLKCCKKDLNNKFFQVDSYKTNKNWGRSYCKIRLKNTTMIENWNPAPPNCQGIWVDLFAYDKCPKFFRKFNRHISVFFERTKLYKNKAIIDFRYKFSAKLFSWLPNSILVFLVNFPLIFWNFLPLKNVCNMCFDYKITQFNIPRSTFENTKLMNFRNYLFPVPHNVIDMLTKKYKNWQEIPKTGNAPSHTHGVIKLLSKEEIALIKETFKQIN